MRQQSHLVATLFAVVLPALASIGVTACDDEKKGAAPAASSTVSATTAPAPEIAKAPPIATAPAPAAKKKEVVCNVGATVEFSDKVLEADVRKKLSKPEGPITPADLKSIRSLNLTGGSVNELDPCLMPLFTSLKDLFLGPGDLEDLTPIAGLTNMEALRASINKVSDLKPLAKLVKLDRLDLARTAVRDLEPLRSLVNLTELQLDDTQILDIGALTPLTKLEKLSLKNTPVKDLSPLKGSRKLKTVNIDGTPVEDISVLAPLVASGLKIVRK